MVVVFVEQSLRECDEVFDDIEDDSEEIPENDDGAERYYYPSYLNTS